MKKLKGIIQISLILFLSFILIQEASARDLSASLGLMPTLAEKGPDGTPKGLTVDLVKAMDKEYKDGSIKIELYPPRRAMDNIIKGKADFYFPFLQNPAIPEEKLPFGYTSATLFEVQFSLYRHKDNKEISADKLKNGNGKFKLETDSSHMNCFTIEIQPSDDMEASLRKVDMGRIDGYIFAAPAGDVAKKLKLNNIVQEPYETFHTKLVIPKGDKGKEIDQILSPIIMKLIEDGTMDKLFMSATPMHEMSQ